MGPSIYIYRYGYLLSDFPLENNFDLNHLHTPKCPKPSCLVHFLAHFFVGLRAQVNCLECETTQSREDE